MAMSQSPTKLRARRASALPASLLAGEDDGDESDKQAMTDVEEKDNNLKAVPSRSESNARGGRRPRTKRSRPSSAANGDEAAEDDDDDDDEGDGDYEDDDSDAGQNCETTARIGARQGASTLEDDDDGDFTIGDNDEASVWTGGRSRRRRTSGRTPRRASRRPRLQVEEQAAADEQEQHEHVDSSALSHAGVSDAEGSCPTLSSALEDSNAAVAASGFLPHLQPEQ